MKPLLLICLLPSLALAEAPLMLADLDGKPVALADVQKDATLVAFWSVACVPCLEEMPLIDALAKRVDAHMTVIGINVDGPNGAAQAKQIVAQKHVSYRQLTDPDRALRKLWLADPDSLSLPTLLVFDRARHAGTQRGFQPGTTADELAATWLPRLAAAARGELHEKLIEYRGGVHHEPTADEMRATIEKMIRAKHPELSNAAIKKRVDAAIHDMDRGKSVRIE